MGNEDKHRKPPNTGPNTRPTLLQAVNLQSTSDTSDDSPSPTKKQCKPTTPVSTSGPNFNPGTDARRKPMDRSSALQYPSLSANALNGRDFPPVPPRTKAAPTPIAPKPTLNSQTFTFNNINVPTISNDLCLYPELLSGDLDPEKFLLSHGVDIFNNKDHRQEFITFCERMLADSLQECSIEGLFTNNNNNISSANYLPPLQPRMPSQFQPVRFIKPFPGPAQFGTPPSSTVTINGTRVNGSPVFGRPTFRPPIQQLQKHVLSGNSQPQQTMAAAHYFDGQKFVPVQFYLKPDSYKS